MVGKCREERKSMRDERVKLKEHYHSYVGSMSSRIGDRLVG